MLSLSQWKISEFKKSNFKGYHGVSSLAEGFVAVTLIYFIITI